jgi:hypothetical protein
MAPQEVRISGESSFPQVSMRCAMSKMGLVNEKAAYVIPLKLPPGLIKRIAGGRGEYVRDVTQNIPLSGKRPVAIPFGIGE